MSPVRRWTRRLSVPTLALVLAASSAPAVKAQEPEAPAGEGGGEGRPFDGYFATGILAGAIIFAVCKSARR
jgi:hypothetical protein